MATGMTRGVAIGDIRRDNPKSSGGSGSPLRSVYDAAATTQAEDYDKIMGNYDDILNSAKSRSSGLNYVPINPVFNRNVRDNTYSRSNSLNNAITGLEDFSKTGGYSDSDVQNIRERSISPIRSIYSSAQEGLRRQKVLSGGYSPNYGAVSSKMARDASSRIGDITTKVNADIAQMIAQGKLSGLQSLAPTAARENELINSTRNKNVDVKNQNDLGNTEEQRRVNTLNTQLRTQRESQGANDALAAVQGKTSLYGTTPALTQLFGNQVLQNNAQNMQAATTANQLKNQRTNTGLNLLQSQLSIPRMGGA